MFFMVPLIYQSAKPLQWREIQIEDNKVFSCHQTISILVAITAMMMTINKEKGVALVLLHNR